MVHPTFDIEKELWDQGHSYIAGVDEAGRGSWAGPVVAAAVVFPPKLKIPKGLRDSKLLSPKKRRGLYKKIKEVALCFAVGQTSPKVIDKKGISKANQQAMRKALGGLDPQPDFSLIDYFRLDGVEESKQRAVKKGDLYCASISAASIIAKVFRDDLMRQLDDDEEFAVYRFGKHKGYGTKLHQEAIAKFGVSRIHRVSFVPKELR